MTRELKEMWLFGPLRGVGEGEDDAKMEDDAKQVQERIEQLLKANAEGTVKSPKTKD